MKTKRYDGSEMRRILAGMVTDQTVCSRIASKWDGGLFDTPWANLVGGWCVEHVQKYDSPPGGQLRGLFDAWSETTHAPEETIVGVEKFLEYLSREHDQSEKHNSDYVLDRADRYFNKVKMQTLVANIEDEMHQGQVERAHGLVVEHSRVELGPGSLVKPAEDYEAWRDAFSTERSRPLFTYPGALDWFLGSAMLRDSLIAFMAPDKVGKSMVLLDAAFRAIKSRLKVGFFDVGDMTQADILMRLGQRAARKPEKPCSIKMPLSIDRQGKVEFEIRHFAKGLEPAEAFKAFKKLSRGKDALRISCHPNSSIDVMGIISILRDWAREGWVADVVVIDYADILAPPSGVRDTLDQIDMTWRQLRRMSQEMHALVLTATQASALAYSGKAKALGKQHFSGRKTKLAHVNGMIGLNSNPEDSKNGIVRVNWVVRRRGRYNEHSLMPVAGCLDLASPFIRAPEKKSK